MIEHVPNNKPITVSLDGGTAAVERCLADLNWGVSAIITQGGSPVASLKFVVGEVGQSDCWELLPAEGADESAQLQKGKYLVNQTVSLAGKQICLPDRAEVQLGAEANLAGAD